MYLKERRPGSVRLHLTPTTTYPSKEERKQDVGSKIERVMGEVLMSAASNE